MVVSAYLGVEKVTCFKWQWVKNMYPKWNPGEWTYEPKSGFSGGLILTHTQMVAKIVSFKEPCCTQTRLLRLLWRHVAIGSNTWDAREPCAAWTQLAPIASGPILPTWVCAKIGGPPKKQFLLVCLESKPKKGSPQKRPKSSLATSNDSAMV